MRIPRTFKPGEKGEFPETWLQDLIYENPEVLPVSAIEPAFDGLIRLGREVPIAGTSASGSAGAADALFVNRTGYLTLVEVKLFRNQEARSDVVAQTVDYLKEITKWSVQRLAEAVAKATPTAVPEGTTAALHRYVANRSQLLQGELDEPAWLDLLQDNLSRGRVLVLIVGDGVRSNVQEMAEVLQGWPQFNFTLGLVELRVYRLADGRRLVIPQVPAKTQQIERVIVRFATPETEKQVTVEGVPLDVRSARKPKYPSTDDFLRALENGAGREARDTSARLLEFLGTEPEVSFEFGSASCNVKLQDPRGSGQALSLFYVEPRGTMVFVGWVKEQQLPRLHLPPALADAFFGAVIHGYGLQPDRFGCPKGLTLARYAMHPEVLHDAVRDFAHNVHAAAAASDA